TITQPQQLILSSSTTGSTCGQKDGSATVSVVSGAFPFTYKWSVSADSQVTATATGLGSGCYSVTVTDGNGCTSSVAPCVNDLGAPTVNLLTQTNVACNGDSTGFAQIAVSGGTPPYTYTWYNVNNVSIGQSTASAFNLSAGMYIGGMEDSTGCKGSVSVTITQPAKLTAAFSGITAVTCFGYCDGKATLTGTGGTLPYTYQWVDPNSQTTATATGLCPGSYNATLTDSMGCDTTLTVSISEPAAMVASVTTDSAYCGTSTGKACVNVTNGSSPFSYQWNDAAAQTTVCANNIAPGNYSVTATDINGCKAVAAGTVNNIPAGVSALSNIVTPSCKGQCNGAAAVSMSGTGTSPYTFLWSNGNTAQM
ncbi:MAG: hypothetical protein FD130_2223, partial [Halothiobacillaceae bacterium]